MSRMTLKQMIKEEQKFNVFLSKEESEKCYNLVTSDMKIGDIIQIDKKLYVRVCDEKKMYFYLPIKDLSEKITERKLLEEIGFEKVERIWCGDNLYPMYNKELFEDMLITKLKEKSEEEND